MWRRQPVNAACRTSVTSNCIAVTGQFAVGHIRLVPFYEMDEIKSIAILISDLSQYEEYKAKTKQLEQQALLGEVYRHFRPRSAQPDQQY